MPTTSPLDAFFAPQTVAVIGASRRPGKLGHDVLVEARRRAFAGQVVGVNPATDGAAIGGWPMVRSVADIGGPVDLALVAVPAAAVLGAVADCAKAGVRAAVIAAAGLGELGGEAADLEAEVAATAARAEMRLLGPNSFGLFVGPLGLNLTTWPEVPAGRVALVTQSGNVAIAMCRQLERAGLGVSSIVAVGNQADVTVADVVAHHAGSPECDAVAVYLEGSRSGAGRPLATALARCRDAGTPVVVLKGGRSRAGAHATATHTGALGGDDRLWDAVLAEASARRVASTEEMVDVLAALRVAVTASTARQSARRGAIVLTDGGGDSVLMLDALEDAGIPLARLSEATASTLAALSPPAAPRAPGGNPVTLDTAGGLEDDPRLLATCAEAAAADPSVGFVVVSGTFGGYRNLGEEELETADRLAAIRDAGTPVLVHSAFADDDEPTVKRLKAAGLAVYPTATRLARALGIATGSTPERRLPPLAGSPASARSAASLLPVEETIALLDRAGIPLPPVALASDMSELRRLAPSLSFPACLKIELTGLSHKSDAGGVVLGLDPETIFGAAAGLWERFPSGRLLVMPMLGPGLELLLGASQDETFGPYVVVGRGGLTAELDPDVAVVTAPADPERTRAAWLSLRCAPLIEGWRSAPPIDLDALVGMTVALSSLVQRDSELSIECNPVFAYPDGIAVADFRATRARSGAAAKE